MERAVPVLPLDHLRRVCDFDVEQLGFTPTFEASAGGRTGLPGVARGRIAITLDCPMEGHGRDACVSLEVADADRYFREWSARVPLRRPPHDEDRGRATPTMAA